ncbi:MAG TPA: hypothetical protein VMI35_13755 [Puia sp.]|nr:hypothetical protein [Puia sp.]
MKIKLLYTIVAVFGSSLFASPKEFTATCADSPVNKQIQASPIALKTNQAVDEDLGESAVAHFFTLEI